MSITPETNILVRAAAGDDEHQTNAARMVLREAETVAVTLSALCELVWVLRKVYRFRATDVSKVIAALLAARNVVVDRPAVDAGLAMLKAGGDFADGAIAHEGRWLGGSTFVSFDQRAVAVLTSQGHAATLC